MSVTNVSIESPVRQPAYVAPLTEPGQTPWKNYQKIAFRIAFLYFFFLCIPTYPAFYQRLFSLKFSKITYNDFQEIVAFWPPQLVTIESEEGVFGIYNYINLILVFVGAVIGGAIWSLADLLGARTHSA